MARVDQRVNYYNFSGGKVSDTNPLAPPENVARTLMNVDVLRDGSITRRLGLRADPGLLIDALGASPINSGFDVYVWQGVDFNPELNLIVIRAGDSLAIVKPGVYNTVSEGLFTLDLSQFKTDSVSEDQTYSFQATSGKGLLVCSGGYYRPFYIKYNSETEEFTYDEIQIRIRDFEGVDDGLEVNERPPGLDYNNHNTISDRHLYNLINQGWARWEINDFHYQTGRYGGAGGYPANSDIASFGRTADRGFQAAPLTNKPVSTGRAPQGHFIIDPFDTTTRGTALSNEPGVGAILSVGGAVKDKRPKAVAFFAGRFFYGSVDGIVYYSQIVEGELDLGKCYQANDPTAEDFNQLLDTDGGTLKLMGVGTVEKMVPMGNSLVIMGTSGIYVVSGGSDKGFTANNQQIGFLSNVVALGYRSIIQTNGPVLFWSDRGIFAIGNNEIGDPTISSLTDYKISKDYNRIPIAAKMVAQACFEPVSNRVYWSYSRHTQSLKDTIINRYTDILVFDLTTGAFWDYQIDDGGYSGIETPYPTMLATFAAPTRTVSETTQLVFDENDETVVDENAEDVFVSRPQYGSSNTQHAVAFIIPTFSSWGLVFGKFTDRTFNDWTGMEEAPWSVVPANYTSVLETLPATLGEPSVKKQTPYLYTYYQTRREGYPLLEEPGGGGGGGGSGETRLSDEWWRSRRWDTIPSPQMTWNGEYWNKPAPVSDGLATLYVTDDGANSNWTQGTPLVRPSSISITIRINSYTGTSEVQPADLRVVVLDHSGGYNVETNPNGPQINQPLGVVNTTSAYTWGTPVGLTSWGETITVDIPLYYRGDDPLIHAIRAFNFVLPALFPSPMAFLDFDVIDIELVGL